jgi:hypothetical protein
LLSIPPAASSASCVFSEASRSEAEKTRKETGSRSCASTVAISPEMASSDLTPELTLLDGGRALALLAEPDLLQEGDEVVHQVLLHDLPVVPLRDCLEVERYVGLVSLPEDVDVLRVPGVVERLHQLLIAFFGRCRHRLPPHFRPR